MFIYSYRHRNIEQCNCRFLISCRKNFITIMFKIKKLLTTKTIYWSKIFSWNQTECLLFTSRFRCSRCLFSVGSGWVGYFNLSNRQWRVHPSRLAEQTRCEPTKSLIFLSGSSAVVLCSAFCFWTVSCLKTSAARCDKHTELLLSAASIESNNRRNPDRQHVSSTLSTEIHTETSQTLL